VLMLNSEDSSSSRIAVWNEIPEMKDHDAYRVVDAWSGKDLGCIEKQHGVILESHDVTVLVVKEAC
jgi:alpha-galactosidase